MEFSAKKRMGLLGLSSAALIATAALGMHGLQTPEIKAGEGAQPGSSVVQDAAGTGRNAYSEEYPEEEFFETETDMTEFEGKLQDITA